MAERNYTYTVHVDTSSLAAAEAEIRQRLGGAMANIQAQPEAQRAAQTTLADFQKLEAELKKIGQVDLTAPADQLQAKLEVLRQNVQQLDAEIRGADVRGGGSTSPQYRAQLEDYYRALAQAQGDEAAALARGRGVVGNIGQINAQFADDTRPADEFTQNAYAQVEEVRRRSREETRQLMEQEARLYATQQAEAQAEAALVAQRIALLEGQLADDDDGRILQAYSEAADEQERLAAAEVDAANSLAEVKKRLREHLETDAIKARKAALQSGDLSAASSGGELSVRFTQNTTAQAERFADQLERAANMEERIAGSVKEQIASNKQRHEDEVQLLRAKGLEAAYTEELIENERTAGATARAEVQKTIAAHAEAEKRITVEARAEATERAAIARRESAVKVEEAREARIRATEEERRQTAAYRAELSQRQRAASQSRGGGILSHIGGELAGTLTGALSIYGLAQGGRNLYEMGRQGAQDLRTVQTFEALAERVGASAEQMQRSIAEASRNTVNDMAAMRLGAQVLAGTFAKTSEDIEGETGQIIKGARRLSQVYTDEMGDPLTTQEVFARLIKYVREGSSELVDQFGLSNRRIAETLGVANEGLRGAEGAALRWQGVVKILGEEMERLGDPVDTEADRIEAAQARITNALDRLRAEAAMPVAGLSSVAAVVFEGAVDSEIGKLDAYKDLASAATDLWQAQKLINSEMRQGDPIVDGYASRVESLGGQLVTGRIGWNAYVEAIREVIRGLGEYQSSASGAIAATNEITAAVYDLTTGMGRMAFWADNPGLHSINQAGGFGPGLFSSPDRVQADSSRVLAAQRAEQEQIASIERIQDRFLSAIDKQEQEQKRAAEKVAAEWKRAADQARDAFASAARAVPGLFGSSPVTQSQLDRAEAGVDMNFADNYLRRLTDEVMNGVEREDVDMGDAARRAGIDPSLPSEIILDMFKESWESGRLFADPANLDLIDLDAVRAEMESQRQGEMGQQNILNLLQGAGLGEDYGVSAAGQLAGGIAGAIPGEFEAANIGGTAGTAIVQQFSAPAAMQAWADAGRIATEGIFSGYQSAIDTSPFASVLVSSITSAVMANLIATFGPQNP